VEAEDTVRTEVMKGLGESWIYFPLEGKPLSLLQLSLLPKYFAPHRSPWGTGVNINQMQPILQY